MKIVYQRVSKASVSVKGKTVGDVGRGVLVLLAVENGDDHVILDWGAKKVAELRAFEDDERKMNRSLLDVGGEALVVSNFTVAGRVKKGRRPSFDRAAEPKIAEEHYVYFCKKLENLGVRVATGSFGAMMDVELVNSGPVTFIIEKRNSDG